MLPGDAALNPCTARHLAVEFQARGRAPPVSLLVNRTAHCLLFSVGCDGKARDAAVRFYGHQTVVGPARCPGKNQDAMIEAGVQAVMHAMLGCTMSVGRFWCLPTS